MAHLTIELRPIRRLAAARGVRPELGEAMELKFGLISADSHAAFDRDTFTSRMSTPKWGDKIPHVAESERDGVKVDGWAVYDQVGDTVCNCPAVMGDPFPHWPQRWDEVPKMAY